MKKLRSGSLYTKGKPTTSVHPCASKSLTETQRSTSNPSKVEVAPNMEEVKERVGWETGCQQCVIHVDPANKNRIID